MPACYQFSRFSSLGIKLNGFQRPVTNFNIFTNVRPWLLPQTSLLLSSLSGLTLDFAADRYIVNTHTRFLPLLFFTLNDGGDDAVLLQSHHQQHHFQPPHFHHHKGFAFFSHHISILIVFLIVIAIVVIMISNHHDHCDQSDRKLSTTHVSQ